MTGTVTGTIVADGTGEHAHGGVTARTGRAVSWLVLPTFIFAHLAHHVGTGGLQPLLPLLRDDFQLDYAQAGLLLSAQGLALGFAQLPVSALADHVSKRLVIAVGLIGTGLLCVGIAVAPGFWSLVGCLAALGFLGATYHAPAASYLAATYEAVARGRALGTHVIGGSLAFLVTPAIAIGTARVMGSWRAAFFALAVLPIVAGLLMLLTMARTATSERAATAAERAGHSGALASLRAIGPLVAVALGEQLLTASMFAYIPLFLVDHHGVPSDLAGLAISVMAGIGIVSAPIGGALSDRFGRAPVLVAVTASVGPLILLLTYAPYGLPLLAGLLLYGLSMNTRLPVLESLFADAIPAHRRSTVLGLYYFIGQESSGLTTPVVGSLIDATDPVTAFTALGIVGTALSLVLLFYRDSLVRPRVATGIVGGS
ncbi:MAG: MFS transporter [Chloroflexi bacterium]|nr:MFS transporter [Chloroflexota bacterium]